MCTEGGRQQLDNDAGPSTDVARKAVEELEGLKHRGEHSAAGEVPDGVVPSALLAAFLSAVGVRNSELAQRLADVIAAQCEGAHWAELARAREVATWLDALGLHVPSMSRAYSATWPDTGTHRAREIPTVGNAPLPSHGSHGGAG